MQTTKQVTHYSFCHGAFSTLPRLVWAFVDGKSYRILGEDGKRVVKGVKARAPSRKDAKEIIAAVEAFAKLHNLATQEKDGKPHNFVTSN